VVRPRLRVRQIWPFPPALGSRISSWKYLAVPRGPWHRAEWDLEYRVWFSRNQNAIFMGFCNKYDEPNIQKSTAGIHHLSMINQSSLTRISSNP
jgi:hypothetical protein